MDPKICVYILVPRTCEWDLIWKKGFYRCYYIKHPEMKWIWIIWVRPKFKDDYPYKRQNDGGRKRGEGERGRGKGEEKRQCVHGGSDYSHVPQVKECLEHQKLGEAKNEFSPEAQRKYSSTDVLILAYCPPQRREYISLVVSRSVCGNLLQLP